MTRDDYEREAELLEPNPDIWQHYQELLEKPSIKCMIGELIRQRNGLKEQLSGLDYESDDGIAKARQVQSKLRGLDLALDILLEEPNYGGQEPATE